MRNIILSLLVALALAACAKTTPMSGTESVSPPTSAPAHNHHMHPKPSIPEEPA